MFRLKLRLSKSTEVTQDLRILTWRLLNYRKSSISRRSRFRFSKNSSVSLSSSSDTIGRYLSQFTAVSTSVFELSLLLRFVVLKKHTDGARGCTPAKFPVIQDRPSRRSISALCCGCNVIPSYFFKRTYRRDIYIY